MNTINPEELMEVLQHWKEAREARLNEVEIAENIRCTVDIVGLLKEHGISVPRSLWGRCAVDEEIA